MILENIPPTLSKRPAIRSMLPVITKITTPALRPQQQQLFFAIFYEIDKATRTP